MKKIFIAIFALMIAANSCCQDLTFLGVPIKGSKADFSKDLLQKGFSYIPDDADSALGGMFYNEPCILQHIVENGVLKGVNVILMPDDSWAFLYAKYISMKNKLRNEFGEPTKDEESFDMHIEPQTAVQKYEAVNDGKCQYQCYWFTPDIGGVAMSITHLKSGENAVIVSYLTIGDITTNMPHIKFKGISLGGPVKEFAWNLEKQGYKFLMEMQGYHVFTGSFAGYTNCSIYVGSAEYEDAVRAVSISFPDQTKWEYLYNNYTKIKDMLKEKYGDPLVCEERFDASKQPTSEYKIMSLLKQDKYKYETHFYVTGGIIKIIISHINVDYQHRFYVSLHYIDGATSITNDKRAIDDL